MVPIKWEIWFVDMPFEEGIGSKPRPVLVLISNRENIVVGKMTTHPPRSEFPYEYQLIDWRGAGLTCQTTLRLSKLARISSTCFIKKIGVIQPVDQINVYNLLQQIIKDQQK
jgi:mRNA interferase MazF